MAREAESTGASVEATSAASARMIEDAQKSVVRVRSGGRGAGAGVVWDEEGFVLTNHHVVAGRRRGVKVQVIPRDGRTLDAKVVGRDRSLDLALLRVRGNPGNLPAAPFGNSDALRAGELVFAIGHPWGRLGAVTAGIVSGLSGAGRGPGGGVRYVRSDVSLAPGNSGGPLLNARGEVVGINAMISGGASLSIPSNVVSAWAVGAGTRRPRLGVSVLLVEVPGALGSGSRVKQTGLIVVAVERDGPAEKAGLLVGDVLLGTSDEPVSDAGSLSSVLSRSGGTVRLRLVRGGAVFEVDVDLEARGAGHAA